jgi:hypothetical protein
MIKKSVFENDLIAGMQKELQSYDKKQGMENLVKAADYLHSAMEILEEAGLTSKADKLLNVLSKIAQDSQQAKTPKADHATKGLTPEKMVSNLEHHGIVFNISDDTSSSSGDSSKADDLLNLDINDALEVADTMGENSMDKTFEDSD